MSSDSYAPRIVTYEATAAATTSAMASACPRMCHRSRRSLRRSITMASPPQLLGRDLIRVAPAVDDSTAAHANHAVRHPGDRGVVGNDGGGGAELAVHVLQHFQHHLAGLVIE